MANHELNIFRSRLENYLSTFAEGQHFSVESFEHFERTVLDYYNCLKEADLKTLGEHIGLKISPVRYIQNFKESVYNNFAIECEPTTHYSIEDAIRDKELPKYVPSVEDYLVDLDF